MFLGIAFTIAYVITSIFMKPRRRKMIIGKRMNILNEIIAQCCFFSHDSAGIVHLRIPSKLHCGPLCCCGAALRLHYALRHQQLDNKWRHCRHLPDQSEVGASTTIESICAHSILTPCSFSHFIQVNCCVHHNGLWPHRNDNFLEPNWIFIGAELRTHLSRTARCHAVVLRSLIRTADVMTDNDDERPLLLPAAASV
jgi:hypothetical protein